MKKQALYVYVSNVIELRPNVLDEKYIQNLRFEYTLIKNIFYHPDITVIVLKKKDGVIGHGWVPRAALVVMRWLSENGYSAGQLMRQ